MLHAVIMAGGAGTRFWPASRATRPKQLLDLAGGRTMIQTTVDRLGDLVTPENVLVVTNRRLVAAIVEQLPQLSPDRVVGEPCKRDTAPCIGLAALLVCALDDDATMAVMPADHVIQPDDRFQATISYAAQLVDHDPKQIVTFGIRPTYPAETFGYIERAAQLEHPKAAPSTYRVKRFREKPSEEIAKQYLATGRYYWNSGIFIWKARTILDALARFEPEMYARLQAIGDAMGQQDYESVLEREFSAINGKSIDFAVMEHYDQVLVAEAPFQWDDVGNWPALARLLGTDKDGNTTSGKHLALKTTDTIVRTDDEHLVVTVGLDNCIVVHTPDATLVANKNDEESIRDVVKLVQEKGWEEYL